MIALSACQSAQKNMKTSSAAASSSKIGAAAEVSSSSAASSASSSSATASSSAAGSSSSNVTASSSKAAASSSKTSSSSKAAATAPAQTAPQKTSSAAQNTPPVQTSQPTDSRYQPISVSKSQVTETVGNEKLMLDLLAHGVTATIDLSGVQQYLCDDVYCTVTENNGTVMTNSQYGSVNNSGSTNIVFGIETYQASGSWWLKPATYTVNVYCKQSEYSLNKNVGRPDTVQIANFSFSVWEQGFKS